MNIYLLRMYLWRGEFVARGVLFLTVFYLFFVVTWQWAVFQKMKSWKEVVGTLKSREIMERMYLPSTKPSRHRSTEKYRFTGRRAVSFFVKETFEVSSLEAPVTAVDYSSTSRKKAERMLEERVKSVPIGARVPLRLDPGYENQATTLLSLSTALKKRASRPALYTMISFGVWFLFWRYRLV